MKKISEHTKCNFSKGVRKLRSPTRGQVSMELILTFSFAILIISFLAIVFYEHTVTTNIDINSNQAGLIARKIADTASSVYYLGAPSTVALQVYMPENIKNITMQDREIVFTLDSGSEIIGLAKINLTGTLSPESGLRNIRISALDQKVNISDDDR